MSRPPSLLPQWSDVPRPVIGMVHLQPLPGSPRYAGSVSAVLSAALRDAEALIEGGVHGLMIENFGDVPFYPGRVPAYVVAHLTAVAWELRQRLEPPIGINVLRNDGLSALAVAHATGAQFIRVNVLCGARVADQGVLSGIAHDLLRERALLGADVKILGDVDVKHSAPLAARPIAGEVDDTLRRGLADALVVSGAGTGKPTPAGRVREVRQAAAGHAPVFVGSGVTIDTLAAYYNHADGFIVGTSLKPGGDTNQPVDLDLVRALVATLDDPGIADRAAALDEAARRKAVEAEEGVWFGDEVDESE